MDITFPTSPAVGDLYPILPVAGVLQFEWNGTAWIASLAAGAAIAFDHENRVLMLEGKPPLSLDSFMKKLAPPPP